MFNFFPFKGGGFFSFEIINKVDGRVQSFFENIDINEITNLYGEAFSDYFQNTDSDKENEEIDFIQFESYDDMYLLTIELKGINLKELSIRYDPGIIEINLNRSETNTNILGIKTQVKKHYNKKFESIEEIDTSNILKSIDKEILTIRMPKKYSFNDSAEIVDIDYTEVESSDKTIECISEKVDEKL